MCKSQVRTDFIEIRKIRDELGLSKGLVAKAEVEFGFSAEAVAQCCIICARPQTAKQNKSTSPHKKIQPILFPFEGG